MLLVRAEPGSGGQNPQIRVLPSQVTSASDKFLSFADSIVTRILGIMLNPN
jgi:hypothetical protein